MAWPLPTGRTSPVDPFFNVNTPEDVAAAERVAAQERGVLDLKPLDLAVPHD